MSIYNPSNKIVIAKYSTQEKSEKAMQLLHETYSCSGTPGNDIGKYHHVFRFPKENEL